MKNTKTKKYFSLKTRITFSIVLFVLVSLAIIFTFSFLNTRKVFRDDITDRLLNMVSIAALQIDSNEHSSLENINDENTESYKNVKQILQKIRDNSTDITYIYTLRENQNNQISFIVDAEEDKVNVSHLADVYEDASPFLKENFLNINKPVVEKSFSTDKWGVWLSGYAPFYDNNGKREGVLGIDISALSIINTERNMLYIYVITFLISGILALVFGLLLGKKLLKSILSINNLVKNTDLVEGKDDTIAIDEFGELTNTIKSTFNKVDLKQKDFEERILNKTKTLEKINKLMVGRELEMIKLKKEIVDLKKVINKED